jgi:hypothetical protein
MPDALNLAALDALAQECGDLWASESDFVRDGFQPYDAAYIAAASPEVVRRMCGELLDMEYAEHHPEAFMRELSAWWAVCGVGGREEFFDVRGVAAEMRKRALAGIVDEPQEEHDEELPVKEDTP